jgi:hypothetical protein
MDSEFVTIERDTTGEIVFIDYYIDEADARAAAMSAAMTYATGGPNPRAAVEIEVQQLFVGDHAHLPPEPLVAYSVERGTTVSSPRSRFSR